MDERFKPRDINEAWGRLIEELGEATAAAGKLQRYGPFSVNPLLPREQQETNLSWVMRELEDIERAARDFRAFIARPNDERPPFWQFNGVKPAQDGGS